MTQERHNGENVPAAIVALVLWFAASVFVLYDRYSGSNVLAANGSEFNLELLFPAAVFLCSTVFFLMRQIKKRRSEEVEEDVDPLKLIIRERRRALFTLIAWGVPAIAVFVFLYNFIIGG